MIEVAYENINGGITLSRELTEEELSAVTHKHVNATHVIFYTGDEPENLKAPTEAVAPESNGIDISNVDVTSLTENQIQDLKQLLNIQ